MKVAIHTGPDTHLDHLAPLCALLDLPLIVTELDHLQLLNTFYPMVRSIYISPADLTLERMANEFQTIFTCGKFWGLDLKASIQLFYNKNIRFVFVPHGNSDKEKLLEKPIHQEIELIYGPQMREAKNSGKLIEMGNLRYRFYLKYQDHFDPLAAPYFQTDKPTVLYAPTWESKATKTSFFDKIDQVIEALQDYHLLIKLHPLLEENDPATYYRILGKFEKQVIFIEKFPPVYPLLKKTDFYLGDYSSVGYDFLTFNRPMYFLAEGETCKSVANSFKENLSRKKSSPRCANRCMPTLLDLSSTRKR
jgi:teichoic acid glycerol-phosphate primase